VQRDQPRLQGSAVRIVGQNVSTNRAFPSNGRIELAFDRYLLPASITRQTFLTSFPQSPIIAYDPVARIVTISPLAPLLPDQTYAIRIAKPSGPTDPDGLRAIDGATIDPRDATIEFPVVAGTDTYQNPLPIDFCRDILPIFTSKCSAAQCHGSAHGAGGPTAAAGLSLDSARSVAATAVGRPAHGANTGPTTSAQPPGIAFGVDMPLIDPGNGEPGGGNPGNSWLLYKLLLAVPPSVSSTSYAGACNGEAPADTGAMHILITPALADPAHDPARSTLTDYVLGREMPFPSNPAAPLGQSVEPLTIAELERVSRWIAESPLSRASDGGTLGTPLVPETCCGQ
jgi:hypothetical protein